MKQKQLDFINALNGLKRDSVRPEDLLNSFYALDNMKLKYEGGLARLIVRNGYERWNTEETAGAVLQLYNFVNQTRDECLMGVVNLAGGDRWYRFIKSSTHELLVDENATVPQGSSAIKNLPIITVGNRVMFGTDTNWRWADADSFYEATKVFQVGIDKPADPATAYTFAPDGIIHIPTDPFPLNITTATKVCAALTPTYDTQIKTITVFTQKRDWNDNSGSWRLKLYTNNAGAPSTTLVNASAISEYVPVNTFTQYITGLEFGATQFNFTNTFTLTAGTMIWIVVEPDDAYYAGIPTATSYGAVGIVSHAVPTYSANGRFDITLTPDAWQPLLAGGPPVLHDIVFIVGGVLNASQVVDYVITYYNSTYGIESRASQKARVTLDATNGSTRVYIINDPTDAQIDKYRVYRRILDDGLDADAVEADITNKYYYLGETTIAKDFIDTTAFGEEGGILQTDDHYRIGEADDNDPHVRTAVLPRIACFWKGRVFVAEGSNLYFSKRLEEDGASGLAGDPIPDYFPPENTIPTYMTSDIIGLKQMGDDQLVLYFANSAIWVLMGFDSTLNPPDPSEYRFVQVVTSSGLIASSALCDIEGGHALLTRRGLKGFSGTPNMPYLSENIKSILDAITDQGVVNSLLINLGGELWLGNDSDADGYVDEFYILDTLTSVPYWRRYDYGIRFGDVIVRESGKYATGSSFKSILASDMDSNYIYELEKGTTDNGQAIDWNFWTHRLRIGRYSTALQLEFTALYPSTPPTFTVTVKDHVDNTQAFSRTPSSSTDVRNHRMGLRYNSPQSLQVGMSGSSIVADEIWGFRLSYNTER